MKTIITTLVLIFCLPLLVISKNPESVPQYNVGKPITDTSLSKNETAFELCFYASGNIIKDKDVTLSSNSIQKKIKTDDKGIYKLILKSGKYKFQFFYNNRFFEIYTDSIKSKAGYKTPIKVYFESSVMPVMAEKPVIYVYAPETTDVSLKLSTQNKLSFTYPEYKDGWNVKTTPSGDLISGKSVYPYLFWEGNIQLSASDMNTTEGFVVSKENLISFMEEKLTTMGLTSKEQTDFITYWCPRMSAFENTYVHFLFNNEVEKYAALDINPKPDNQFRVFMVWTSADKIKLATDLRGQKIPSFNRTGLTVVEWGGAEINMLNP